MAENKGFRGVYLRNRLRRINVMILEGFFKIGAALRMEPQS